MKKILISMSIVIMQLMANNNIGPSYNCSYAKSYVEKAICNSVELSKLDRVMVDIYNDTYNSLGENQQNQLKKNVRDWVKYRDSNCEGRGNDCIMNEYNRRVQYLKNLKDEYGEKAYPNIKEFSVSDNGIDILVTYQSKVKKGEKFYISVVMRNNYKYARTGGLTLSFPQIKYTKGIYSDNTFDSIKGYSFPDKIYNRIVKKNIKSKYYMIEGWEKKWQKGEKRKFIVAIDIPDGIKELLVNIRGVLVEGRSKLLSKDIVVPEYSNSTDQQGYRVKQLSIPIERSNIVSGGFGQKRNKEEKTKPKQNNKKQEWTGTGFFIDKKILLTNYHVVHGCKNLEVFNNSYRAKAKIKALDKINDLAVLSVEKEHSSILKFRSGKGARVGEKIIVMGYPFGDLLGTNIKLTLGNVSSTTGLLNDSTTLQLTAPVQGGNSGGPLLDKHGNVIGVIYAKLSNTFDAENVNLAVKSNIARMFLDSNDINYYMDENRSTKEVVDIADEAKNSIVEVVCRQ